MATALPHQKSTIFFADCPIMSININLKNESLVCEMCSVAWRIFWPSPIFDIFKTQQEVAQKYLYF